MVVVMGWMVMQNLQVLVHASAAAQPGLLLLVSDGRLDGFEEIALGLQDGFDGLHPLRRRFRAGRIAHEARAVGRARAAAPAASAATAGC